MGTCELTGRGEHGGLHEALWEAETKTVELVEERHVFSAGLLVFGVDLGRHHSLGRGQRETRHLKHLQLRHLLLLAGVVVVVVHLGRDRRNGELAVTRISRQLTLRHPTLQVSLDHVDMFLGENVVLHRVFVGVLELAEFALVWKSLQIVVCS